MRRWTLSVTIITIVAACGRGENRSDQAPDRASQATVTASSDFPSSAVRELAAAHDSVTLGAWLGAHPGDTLEMYRPNLNGSPDDRWCARATRTVLGTDSTAVRYAYFYMPAPADFTLPAESPNLIQEQCRLGAILVQTRDLHNRGMLLAGAVRDSLSASYGAGQRVLGTNVVFGGSAYWDNIGWWSSGSTIVVSAYDQGMSFERPERVLAFAYRAAMRFGDPTEGANDHDDIVAQRTLALMLRAARLSGLDSAHVAQLRAAYDEADRAYHTTKPWQVARVEARAVAGRLRAALTEWVTASQTLAPAQRAAALVAADQVLASEPGRYVVANDSGGGTEQALAVLGARFARDQLGGGNAYLRALLDSAQRLDSGGPAGRLATLAWLRVGFNSGMCGGTESASQRVSAGAERLLGDANDSSDMFELHELAGDGYADIVALAAGAVSEYADSTAYIAAAPEARRRAIQHYREASLAGRQATLAERRAVWLKGWRLIVGLPPEHVRFYCVYD